MPVRHGFCRTLAAMALAMPVVASAQLARGETRDMACYVAMNLSVQKVLADPKAANSAKALENLKIATVYFGGKVAARHPGGNVPTLVKANGKAVQSALKTLDGKACLEEIPRSLEGRK